MLVDLVDVDTGAPVEVSPRRILQAQVEQAAAAGYVPMIGSEVEFFLFKEGYDEANAAGYRDLTPNSPYLEDYHILQTTKEEDVLGAIRRGLARRRAAGRVHQGRGRPRPARAQPHVPDGGRDGRHQPRVQDAVKEIAHPLGKSATFMAKPYFDDAGSSCHIHSSLWSTDGATQPDADDADDGHDPHHMSELFRWYLGGLMATAREFSLLFAPTVNSYKRFQPGSWAPTGIGWDVDNRTLGFRVVGHGQRHARREPHPGRRRQRYHAFAATIAGGLHGIAQPHRAAARRTTATATPRPTSRASRRRSSRRSTCGATARSPASASATTCTTTSSRHAESEWRAFNQHRHRLGARAATSSASDPPRCPSDDFHKHFRGTHEFRT